MTIVLSVAMPLYRAASIAWLALESLCRQAEVDFAWELLIAEEIDAASEPFGREALGPYVARLAQAGCVDVTHVELDGWLPLARKWRLLAAHAAPSSRVFALQGGDDYSAPLRLAHTVGLLASEGADWIHTGRGLFYDLPTGHLSLFDRERSPNPTATGVSMAMRTALVRDLPREDVARGVDGWLLRHVAAGAGGEAVVVHDESDQWTRALYTDGHNTCSTHRAEMARREVAPFSRWPGTLLEIVPEDVAARLDAMRAPSEGAEVGDGA